MKQFQGERVQSVTLDKSFSGRSELGAPDYEVTIGDMWVRVRELEGQRRTIRIHASRVLHVTERVAPVAVRKRKAA